MKEYTYTCTWFEYRKKKNIELCQQLVRIVLQMLRGPLESSEVQV